MKVYIVISAHGEYEDYTENIEEVFANKEAAETFAKAFDDEHVINYSNYKSIDSAIYTIVPRDIMDSWPHIEPEDPNEEWVYDKEYCGYTLDDFKKQDERECLSYYNWRKCRIEEYEVK